MENVEVFFMKKNKITLMPYISRYKFGVAGYILTTLIGGVCSIFGTMCVARAIEALTSLDYELSLKFLGLMLILYLVRRFIWSISGVLYDVYTTKIMSNLNTDLARQAFKLNSESFSSHDTGTFVQRIVADPEEVVDNLARLVDMLTDVLTSFGMIVYISFLNVYIGISIMIVIMGALTIQYFNLKARKKLKTNLKNSNDAITSLTTEIVRSEKDVKSLALEDKLSEVSSKRYGDYKKARFKLEFTTTKFIMARCFFVELLSVAILILGVVMLDRAVITLATFMLVYSNHMGITDFIWSVSDIASGITDIKVGTKRMFALFDENEFVVEKFGDKSLSDIRGDIEFKNVDFSFKDYEFVTDKKHNKTKKLVSEKKIFENLSFKISRNSTVAFVGKSGSGKSTILNLICKMIEVDNGEVLIDGVDIKTLDKLSLRSCFSLVNQSPYIFDMTIKENLLLARGDASDDEVMDAINKAALGEFVDSLPSGIDTKVGESGIKLSGGQKQRLAIARAFLKKSSVILFDESTSALDNFSQEYVKESINSIKGKSTIVIVAHRLSTIKDVDTIFFLDEGKIIDSGSFDELFARNEKFKRMFLAENIDNF